MSVVGVDEQLPKAAGFDDRLPRSIYQGGVPKVNMECKV